MLKSLAFPLADPVGSRTWLPAQSSPVGEGGQGNAWGYSPESQEDILCLSSLVSLTLQNWPLR